VDSSSLQQAIIKRQKAVAQSLSKRQQALMMTQGIKLITCY
jgi:hypothetical protein